MQQKHLFEYAVIRLVPRVEREEFTNIGVILFCAKQKFLQARYLLDGEKLKAFCADIDLSELKEHICALERICTGDKTGGTIGLLDAASRFRWLTATRSTIVQTSKVHPGFCDDPSAMLDQLFEQMVA